MVKRYLHVLVISVFPWSCLFCLSQKKKLSLNQAIQNTLLNQWGIAIAEEEVDRQTGFLEESQGPFDPLFSLEVSQNWWNNSTRQLGLSFPEGTSFSLPIVETVSAKNPGGFTESGQTTIAKASLQKKLRLGTLFSLGFELNRQKNPFFLLEDPYPSFDAFQDTYIREATANAFFTINQPLLKGFLSGAEAVNEKSRSLELEASKYFLLHKISKELLQTIDAYWDYVGAKEKLLSRKNAEKRVEIYTKDVKKLVEKNQLPKTALTLPNSSLSSTKTEVVMAKQELVIKEQILRFSMGIDVDRFFEGVDQLEPLPLFSLPKGSKEELIRKAPGIALQNRYDIKGLKKKQSASYKQIIGAKNEALPELNLVVTGRQTNTNYEKNSHLFEPFHMIAPKKEIQVVLSLSYPLFRSRGLGRVKSAKAEKRQIDLSLNQTKSQIFSSVIEAMNDLYFLEKEVKEAQLAEEQASKYVSDQSKLFRSGLTSLFELIDAQTRLVFTEIQHIDARVKSAKNLAKIQFLLGTMIECNEEGYLVRNISQLPKELDLKEF